MKSSIKGLVVILVIVMSLVVVQRVCAETVIGTVEEISETVPPNKIVVKDADDNLMEISGVRYNYMCNQYNICLETGMEVTIEYYTFECRNDHSVVKYMATSITVGDVTVDF
jgi:hypothetical protein